MKKPLYKNLLLQVITAIVLGILVGHFWPETGIAMKPLGDAFINLIKMMIAPIIFCTIVSGVTGMGNMKQVGRVGAKALFYFEVITTLALFIGFAIAEVVKPGSGMNVDMSQIDITATKAKVAHAGMLSTGDFFMHMIPSTLISPFASGEILQVLVVAVLFAWGLSHIGERGRAVINFIEAFSNILFKMVDLITKLAPLGAFGAMAFTVGKFGLGSLKELGTLVLLFYGSCALFIFVVLGSVMRFYCKLSLLKFLGFIGAELSIVLGTSSSESVLPRLMEKLTRMGISKPVVGMVVPAGYSFNLDGSSIYFTLGALFIAYATGTHLTFWQEMSLIGILLVTSKGAAGVTGSAFIVLAATLSSMQIMPQESLDVGLALIFAVDRFMSTGRAITNLIGNGVATIAIAKWENALDYHRAHHMLNIVKI